MKRCLLGVMMVSLVDPAFASGVRAGNIAPIMIAPLFLAGSLALYVGALVSKNREAGAGWLAGGAVLVLTVVLSRLLVGFGFIAAVCPQIIVGIAVLMAWRKETTRTP